MSERPVRLRLSRARGWRLPDGAINVARPGKWGNPFVVGRDGTREQCVAKFYQLCRGFIDLGCERPDADTQLAYFRHYRRRVAELYGRDLACWCALDGKPCHADVLLFVASGVPIPATWPNPMDIGRVRLGILATDLERSRRVKSRRELAEAKERMERDLCPRCHLTLSVCSCK